MSAADAPALADPGRWWSYNAPLDPELVVITPALEGDSGLDGAGDLPLAEEPRFPEARQRFLAQLRAHGQTQALRAMALAMGTDG